MTSIVTTLSADSALPDWLAHAEHIHAKPIDMGLDRVQRVADRMGLKLDAVVITVAGTNGKGSTCAMLEAILHSAGYKTGLYTSPHLVHFNERCRVNAAPSDDATLAQAMALVEEHRGTESITYFEFTTLAILHVLAAAQLDAVILEVGLGGRLDAVNIIDADCAIITAIDLDHMEFLGPDRESIGFEKAGIMRKGTPCIHSDPVPTQSMQKYAAKIGADLWLFSRDFNYSGDKLQWAWAGREQRRSGLGYPALRGANQLINASGVLAALEALKDKLPVGAQDVRTGLALVELPGRFQVLAGQPTVVLDVAHNPHSVAALAENLDNMGFFPQTIAVFGAMADKDLEAMYKRIGPLIDHWVMTDLPLPRAAKATELRDRLLPFCRQADAAEKAITLASNPIDALMIAGKRAGPLDRIVIFGSFYTVGGVLEHGLPQLNAHHVAKLNKTLALAAVPKAE
jgi:dihydrofolate synthase / folylpolyglutamate synthase